MQLLFGALIAAVFFILVFLIGFIGYKIGNKNNKPSNSQVNDEEMRKQKKIHEDFVKMMNYDVETALQQKVNK